jgi:hypothetical protein
MTWRLVKWGVVLQEAGMRITCEADVRVVCCFEMRYSPDVNETLRVDGVDNPSFEAGS